MKILLDECVPLPVREILNHHDCRTAQQMGWKNIENGVLLDLVEGEFDLFITADRSENRHPRTLDEQIASHPSCRQPDQRYCRFAYVSRVSSD